MRTQTQKTQDSTRAKLATWQRSSMAQYSHPVLKLQNQIGNQAVQRLIQSRRIQAKLTIGQPNDKYEQEADRVADQVMRMPEPKVQRLAEPEEKEEEPFQTKSITNPIAPLIQRQHELEEYKEEAEPDKEEKPTQTKSITNESTPTTAGFQNQIGSLKGGGQPLLKSEREFLEPRFGADFSHVRVHSDASAAHISRSINARAFTHGHDVVFGAGQYSPGTHSGRKLLAHELTHVVQQNSGSSLFSAGKNTGSSAPSVVSRRSIVATSGSHIQRTPCPSSHATGEVVKSLQPAGFLKDNIVYDVSINKLYIQDFGVDSTILPANVTKSPPWQRVMSIIAGTPALKFVGVFGYSDCLGSDKKNISLRSKRAKAVFNAMPSVAKVKVLMTMGDFVSNFITTNDTPENRAKNRAVIIKIAKATGPKGKDLCDFLAVASDLDQYMFLVRCLEKRLGLTSASDAHKTLSVLRQIYYGNTSWSASKSKIWDSVITQRPWSPGTDPGPKLGKTLFKALQKSQKVNNKGTMVDIGHLLTGLDAMRKGTFVNLNLGPVTMPTNVENHEWATWAGDVGSAAANYAFCVSFLKFTSSYNKYFKSFANDSDLEGDIDSYANWSWLDTAANKVDLKLNMPLSEMLMQYYRLTNTKAGKTRADRFEIFVNYYGGQVKSKKVTKPNVLEKKLLASISEFAVLFFGQKVLKAYRGTLAGSCIGKAPARHQQRKSVGLGSLIRYAISSSKKMTKIFIKWLETRLRR